MKKVKLKSVLIVAAMLLTANLSAQFSLEKLWETDAVLTTPESVLYDAKSKVLFVSNIGDFEKEGSGSISKVGMDGKIIQNNWINGLTATKGMGLHKNLLYAAEQSTVAVIDITKGEIMQRVAIEGAQMLNDITIDNKGVVYVSDSRTGKVHKIENGRPSTYLENLNGINGLLADGRNLLILSDGKLREADSKGNIRILSEGIEGGADGIVKVGNGEFIVTGWSGIVYLVRDNGAKMVLMDTREQKINTADLGYNPSAKTIYIPTFSTNTVAAYRLRELTRN